MTLPGLALFYGGLVRRKNVLSVLAQCLGITGLVTILWWLCGYSLVFARGSAILGDARNCFLAGVDSAPKPDYAPWVRTTVFAMYQMMFAIITPALIVGAIAERMKFAAIMVFVARGCSLVYFPLAHMVWGVDGLHERPVESRREDPGDRFRGRHGGPHVLGLERAGVVLDPGHAQRVRTAADASAQPWCFCMVGTGMLWVGWYGFNAGSALAADGIAANAFMTTTLAAAVAAFTWGTIE